MDPYFFLQITPEILGAHRHSRVEALKKAGVVGLVDALLPEEFVDGYADRALAAPDWLGFWVLKGGEVIGSGGYKSAPVDGITEIGYGIHPEFWSKGAATALCDRLVSHAFSLGATTVRAHTLHEGVASQKVLTKNGFEYVGDFDEPEDGIVMRWERS